MVIKSSGSGYNAFKCSVQRQFCEITFTLGYNNWNRHCKSGLVYSWCCTY